MSSASITTTISHRDAFTIGSNGPPLGSLTITDYGITDVGTGGTLIYVRQGTGLGTTLPVTITDVRWRSSTSNAYALLPASKVSLVGTHTVTSDIAGLA